MKRNYISLLLFGLALTIGVTGCTDSQTQAPSGGSHTHSDGTEHHDGDSHDDHDHASHENAGETHDDHDHSVEGHSHGAGPHGGTIVDWGGGTYHLEFTVDHAAKTAKVYVLGSDEKTPTPIAATEILLAMQQPALKLQLKPAPQDGEAAGQSSVFQTTDEALATEQNFQGTISGVIDGTPYSGKFKESVH